MTKNLNNGLKKYYREIGKSLSCSNKEKERILDSIKSSVECYLFENPDASIDDILKKFGSAKEIAEEYYNNESTEDISTKIKIKKKILVCVVASLAIALVMYGIVIASACIADIEKTNGDYVTYITETTSATDIEGENQT